MSSVLHPHTLLPLLGCVSFLLGTNINDAVLAAVSELVIAREQGNLPERSIDMVILLTDGMPNEGTNRLSVKENKKCSRYDTDFFSVLVISSILLCLLKESTGSQRSRKTYNQQWGETCLCSVLDLATV